MYAPHKWGQPLLIGCLGSLTTQSDNATGANRKQRPLLNMWPTNCWASVAKSWSPHMSYGVFSLAEPSLTLAWLRLNRRPTCQYGTMWRVYRGCSRDAIFASGSKVFFVFTLLRTIFNYLILCRGLGLRFWVMFKTGTITPNGSVQMLWASLGETTDQ